MKTIVINGRDIAEVFIQAKLAGIKTVAELIEEVENE